MMSRTRRGRRFFGSVRADLFVPYEFVMRLPRSGEQLSLARSAASRACGPCTASNGTCHTRRFSDLCGICPAADRRHRKYPCRRAQADCGRAIHVAHVVVQQKLAASASLTAQRPSSAADKPRSGLAVGWSALLCIEWLRSSAMVANPKPPTIVPVLSKYHSNLTPRAVRFRTPVQLPRTVAAATPCGRRTVSVFPRRVLRFVEACGFSAEHTAHE